LFDSSTVKIVSHWGFFIIFHCEKIIYKMIPFLENRFFSFPKLFQNIFSWFKSCDVIHHMIHMEREPLNLFWVLENCISAQMLDTITPCWIQLYHSDIIIFLDVYNFFAMWVCGRLPRSRKINTKYLFTYIIYKETCPCDKYVDKYFTWKIRKNGSTRIIGKLGKLFLFVHVSIKQKS